MSGRVRVSYGRRTVRRYRQLRDEDRLDGTAAAFHEAERVGKRFQRKLRRDDGTGDVQLCGLLYGYSLVSASASPYHRMNDEASPWGQHSVTITASQYHAALPSPSPAARKRASQKPVSDRVVEYIEQNYARQISLRDVASAMGYSPSHLTTAFRQATGIPVTAWIIKRRIAAARQLLGEADLDVATTSERVGFSDLCYFTRQFVRHVGVTPGRFRASMNGVSRSGGARRENSASIEQMLGSRLETCNERDESRRLRARYLIPAECDGREEHAPALV
jgi:AraC-like DNA-binding protein